MRTFAEDTSVPVARSRGEIDSLLREWGCSKIGWTDEFDERRATLQFVWTHEGSQYLARFALPLPKPKDIRHELECKTNWEVPQSKVDKLVAQGERAAYRVLLLKIKADLNAVRAGIVTAEAVFLSWLVGADGQTVAEALVPRMRELMRVPADRLLPAPGGGRP